MPSKRTVRSMQIPLLLVLALLLTTVAILPGFAAHDEGFELDGNVANDGELDWEDFFEGPGTITATTPRPAGFIAASPSPDHALPDVTTFTQGSKDTLDIDQWSCASSNNVNSKVDITNAYTAAQRNAEGDLIITFGMEIRAPEGNSNVGMWFLKDPDAGCSAEGGTTSFSGNHVEGDVLLVSAFTNGGNVANVTAYRFSGGALIPAGTGGRCDEAEAGDLMCAMANDSQSFDTPWLSPDRKGADEALAQNTFFEGGINITDTFATSPEDECFNKFLANTRSSQSLTATLFDYTIGELSICGGLTIVKETDPEATDEDFDFTVVGPDVNDSFKLNASTDEATEPDRKTYSDVFAGNYTISETVPGGWDLIDITCVGADNTAIDVGYELGDTDITVDVGVEADVTCTFTNRLRHSILIVKTGPDGLLAGAEFTATGPGDSEDDYVLTEGPDGIHCIDDLVPGTYGVEETVTPTGYKANANLPDVTTSNTSTCTERLDGVDPSAEDFDLEDFITSSVDLEVPNQPSPVDLTVTKWKLTMDESGELVRSTTPLQFFAFTLYEGDELNTDGLPTGDPIAGPTDTAANGEVTFQDLAVGETFTVCETAVPVYGDDDDAGYWSEGGCQSFTTALDTDVELDFDNAPRADVTIEFFDVTGYTSIDVECFDADAEPGDDPIGELSVAHGTAEGGGSLDLSKLDLGDYDCTLQLRNGQGTPAPEPTE